jgi:hypothetical protein
MSSGALPASSGAHLGSVRQAIQVGLHGINPLTAGAANARQQALDLLHHLDLCLDLIRECGGFIASHQHGRPPRLIPRIPGRLGRLHRCLQHHQAAVSVVQLLLQGCALPLRLIGQRDLRSRPPHALGQFGRRFSRGFCTEHRP